MEPIEDNYDQWKRHDDRMEAALERLPKCADCGEAIDQEVAIEFDGCLFCEDCIREHHTVAVIPG